MIHSDTEPSPFYEASQAAYLRTHPFINAKGLHNDLAAIEWRHGYITAARERPIPEPSAAEQAIINRFGIFDEEMQA
jgi:hypothetical protein